MTKTNSQQDMSSAITLEEKLQAMRRAGVIRWNGKKLRPMKLRARVKVGQSVAQLILDERR